MHLTFRYRVKDRDAKRLEAHARAVNYVWNFCGETQRHAMRWRRKWPSRFDLIRLTAGVSRELNLNSRTVEEVCTRFVASRAAIRHCPRWRGRKSLGWVPFNHADGVVKIDGDAAVYLKRRYRLWYSRPIRGKPVCGSFSQDARGRWYFNLVCDVPEEKTCGTGAVAIDLGLKTFATLSDGSKIENPRHFRRYEAALATAQRAGRKDRTRAIQAKIANSRRHHLHEQSTRLVRTYGKIIVGDVNSAQLAQTGMAKSVFDASWSSFRTMLRYKSIGTGAEFVEMDERYSTQTCSSCHARSGPKGRKGLRVREWICEHCGSVHDRDVNAAVNLLLGAECRPPLAGSPVHPGGH